MLLLSDDDHLLIPSPVAHCYVQLLKELDLTEKAALSHTIKSCYGGASSELTYDHFAYRFPASFSRPEYLLLDPLNKFIPLTDEIEKIFSFGSIRILDIPCGAGAGSLGLISTLAYNRDRKTAVPLPLSIHVIAADISPTALELTERMHTKLAPTYSERAITVTLETRVWDASKQFSTSSLCNEFFRNNNDTHEHFVLITDISGVGSDTFETFSSSISELISRLAQVDGGLLWIEPQIKKVKAALNKFVDWLYKIGIPKVLDFTSLIKSNTAEYKWRHPVTDFSATGRLTIQKHIKVHSDE